MEEQEFEHMLSRLMGRDYSNENTAFRDELLKRCLAVLDADSLGSPIADDDLELLAAAGDMLPNMQDWAEPEELPNNEL